MIELSTVSDNVKDAAKVGVGAVIMAFFVLVAKLYRVWKVGQSLEKKYAHVTDETIRKELWTQWALMSEENKTLSVDLQKVKGMHANCLEETGVLVGKLNEVERQLAEMKEAKL